MRISFESFQPGLTLPHVVVRPSVSGALKSALRVGRTLWMLLGVTLLMLVGAELVLRVIFGQVDESRTDAAVLEVQNKLPPEVYGQEAWVEQFAREASASKAIEWHPYVYWRRKPYKGQYINVDEAGIRRTVNATTPAAGVEPLRVFVFGGSTVWGTGARDDHTIPSLLAQKLRARFGPGVEVTNFGETAYVSSQEVIALMRELRRGNLPDLVIFYDGVNDTLVARERGVAGATARENEVARLFARETPLEADLARYASDRLALFRLAREIAKRLVGPGTSVLAAETPAKSPDTLMDEVVDVYLGNVRLVQALGAAHGYASAFYWQPSIVHKERLTAWERRQDERGVGGKFQHRVDQILRGRLQSDSSLPVRDLSETFTNDRNTVFIDQVHITEAGNERIAERIAETLPPLKRRMAR